MASLRGQRYTPFSRPCRDSRCPWQTYWTSACGCRFQTSGSCSRRRRKQLLKSLVLLPHPLPNPLQSVFTLHGSSLPPRTLVLAAEALSPPFLEDGSVRTPPPGPLPQQQPWKLATLASTRHTTTGSVTGAGTERIRVHRATRHLEAQLKTPVGAARK